ncbi:MAG: GNAT family N-acetyltransferase [Clostridia bacterium]|nr:GNAT family N-acetyltransferase [Clostridia bacterium]
MDAKFYSCEEFEDLKNIWNQLEIGEEMTAFQSYEWYNSLNKLIKRETRRNIFRECFYVVVYEGEKPVMIAPLQYVKVGIKYSFIGIKRGFYFIGRNGYTDYCNFIYKDFNEKAAETIFREVSKKFKTNFFGLELVPENTSLSKYIQEEYTRHFTITGAANLEFPDTFDEYHKNLSKNMRQNIRTSFNRQNRDGIQFKYEMKYEPLSIEARKILMEIRSGRVAAKRENFRKNASLKSKITNTYSNIVKSIFDVSHDIIFENLNTWTFLVTKDDEIASFLWGIKDLTSKKHYVIYAGVDKKYEWYSPNNAYFYKYIEDLYNNGSVENGVIFDFTRGNEKYKFDLGCKERKCLNYNFRYTHQKQ